MSEQVERMERVERSARVGHAERARVASGAAAVGADDAGAVGAAVVALVGYAPITRVDAERREIELCATSEALDAHGTIFDYAASKEAFTRWLGNVREMHERRAVGRRVGVRCDDEARRIYVRLRISHGAQDTWEKVLDGTLRGASIGASDVIWRRERRTVAGRSRWVNVTTRYDLVELSLVDNPSNPDTLGVTFVRDASPDVTLLDPLEAPEPLEALETPEPSREPEARPAPAASEGDIRHTPDVQRAEASDAPGESDEPGERREALPALHQAARAALAGCGCLLCEAALAVLADDAAGAGDDAEAPEAPEAMRLAYGGARAMSRALAAALHTSAARLARMDATVRATVDALQREAERAAQATRDATEQRVAANQREGAQAAQVVEELRARVARLEAQPASGGPVARPVEKTLAGAGMAARFGGAGGSGGSSEEVRALEALAGRLRDPQAQLAVAAEMIRLQQRAGAE